MTTGKPAETAPVPRRRRRNGVGTRPALPVAVRAPLAVIAAVAALLCASLAIVFAGDATADRVDGRVGGAVDAVMPGSGSAVHAIDAVGQPTGALLSVGVLASVCWGLGRVRLALAAIIGMALAAAVALLVKPAVGRTIHGGFLSYPSGHTATATVLALVAMLLLVDLLKLGRLAGVLLIVSGTGVAAVIMASDQIASGAHYPTDTLGGLCVGAVAVPAAAHAVDRLADRAAGRCYRDREEARHVTEEHRT